MHVFIYIYIIYISAADPWVVPDEEEELVIEEPDSLAVCPPQISGRLDFFISPLGRLALGQAPAFACLPSRCPANRRMYRGASLIRNSPSPRTTIGP